MKTVQKWNNLPTLVTTLHLDSIMCFRIEPTRRTYKYPLKDKRERSNPIVTAKNHKLLANRLKHGKNKRTNQIITKTVHEQSRVINLLQ